MVKEACGCKTQSSTTTTQKLFSSLIVASPGTVNPDEFNFKCCTPPGTVIPDEEALDALRRHSYERRELLHQLKANECSHGTASYYLLREASAAARAGEWGYRDC